MATPHWNVVVCGTRFGRVYMSALAARDLDMDLVGILANGSERSKRVAERFDVPLFTDVADLPDDVDAACVAISSEMGGGPGTDIAIQLLERGVSVLQENPMHHDELVRALAAARRFGAVHQLSTLYPYLDSVRRFLAAGSILLREYPPMYIDGACALQLKTSFFDIIGRLLGRLQPWEFRAPPSMPCRTELPPAFRSVEGVIAGIPASIRIQNQIHATDPDNHCHLYHCVSVGTAVGTLSLVDTHGPLLWRPRPHVPASIQDGEFPEQCADPVLDLDTVSVIAEATSTWRQAMVTDWPAALGRQLIELRRRACGERVTPDPQYALSLSRMVHDVEVAVGSPEVIRGDSLNPIPASRLLDALADW